MVMACVAAFDRVLQAGIDPSYICTHALPCVQLCFVWLVVSWRCVCTGRPPTSYMLLNHRVLAPLVYLRTLSAAQFEKVAGRVQAMLSR